MPICTYMSQQELERTRETVTDPEVLEWLGKVQKLCSNAPEQHLYVEQRAFLRRHPGIMGLFRKKYEVKRYTVYYPIVACEVQVGNFCSPPEESSICTWITREELVDYLIGWVQGFEVASKLLRDA